MSPKICFDYFVIDYCNWNLEEEDFPPIDFTLEIY